MFFTSAFRTPTFVVFLLLCGVSVSVNATWYQAQGTAVVLNGNKDAARRQATEDAIRQALLFAGASVSSSSTLMNGLLKENAMQITTRGEVKRVEMVSEHWQKDRINVTIRAQIFPDTQACGTQDYAKSIISAPFTVQERNQLVDGNIQRVNLSVVQALKKHMTERNSMVTLDTLLPTPIAWRTPDISKKAMVLGRQYDAQLALFGHIEDASVARTAGFFSFGESDALRSMKFRVILIDTINGALLMDEYYSTQATWAFQDIRSIDPFSSTFWDSAYGREVMTQISKLSTDVIETVKCQPTTGRVISVQFNQLKVSLGRAQGLTVNDELTLYQKSQIRDEHGRMYTQYNLHPETLKVVSVSVDNAVVEPVSGGLLGNIQPNDFVTTR